MPNIYGNVEIYKDTDCLLSAEYDYIEKKVEIRGNYCDTANELFAFALNCNDETAENLVDELNEKFGNHWYIGDDEEEYVFVN